MTPYFITFRIFRQDSRVDGAAVRHSKATHPREAPGIAAVQAGWESACMACERSGDESLYILHKIGKI